MCANQFHLKTALIISFFASFFLLPNQTFASITSVSGDIGNNQSIIISGSGFGSNLLSYEWTGSNIEAGTVGSSFSKAGWTVGQAYLDMVYASDQARSGSKSLKASVVPGAGTAGSDIRFNGQEVGPDSDLYMSWWVRRTVTDAGQWKMLRISEINDVVDHAYEQTWFNWNNGTGYQIFTRNTTTSCSDGGTCDYGGNFPASDNVWYRIEMVMHTSSTSGGDGNYTQGLYTPGSTRRSHSRASVSNWSTAGHSYSWYIFQNWIGNGISAQTHWMDDIFIQSGTQARVELCDSATWASRTSCDIQIPLSWSDTSITVNVNAGAFTVNDAAYLYVVDSNGDVNANGYLVEIGASLGGGAADSLAPPPELRLN